MKITIEPTTKILTVDGVAVRVWEGQNEAGVPVAMLVARITPMIDPEDARVQEFQRELRQVKPPTAEVQMWPLRLVL